VEGEETTTFPALLRTYSAQMIRKSVASSEIEFSVSEETITPKRSGNEYAKPIFFRKAAVRRLLEAK
jgi:hypothetical protein